MYARFLNKLRDPNACLFGTWVKLPAVEVIESLAFAGFNFVVLDMEHAPITFESVYRSIVVAQGLGMSALVRLPGSEDHAVQRVLDSGADGVLVPRIRNAAEAKRMVDSMIFSPAGSRGLGMTSRAGLWGERPRADYLREGDEQVMRGLQLEDPEALRSIDEILDVPGANAIFIGAGDLSLTTGRPASDPENAALVEQALAAARRRGVPCGTAVGDASAAVRARRNGYNFVMVSNDLSMFIRSARSLLAQVQEA